jgi:flagellar protein FliT
MPPPDDGAAHGVRLVDRYEQIAAASHQMLAAARHGDWEAVARLEDACRVLIGELERQATQVRLTDREQRRRIALLRSILADDAEVRQRSEPWLQQLEQLLQRPRPAERRPPDA